MEYLIMGIVKLPDNATEEDIARFEATITERIKLEELSMFYEYPTDRNPLVYWSFHPLDLPFPLDWGK